MQTEIHKPRPLFLLGVICDKEQHDKVMGVLEAHKALFHLATYGRGTANSKILGYLGLGETEKRVFFSVMPAETARQALQKLDEKMDFKRPGHGVAYLMSIHEGCYHRPVQIPQEENGGKTMENEANHNLILVILNRGYTEEVMDAARGGGATGGTVIHARGCGLAGAEKFFGVTIQPEKEMILILAKTEVSCSVMNSIAEQAGPETDAGAVSFSVPAAEAYGIGNDLAEMKKL